MLLLEWDEDKRRRNLERHGLDFEDARLLDWDGATVIEDTRFDYPEPRFCAIALGNDRYHIVTFCWRGRKLRIISFRKASDREVRRYGKKI
jgi:uncharacterized protein